MMLFREFRNLLRITRDKYLRQLAVNGFYCVHTKESESTYRFDAAPWDINNGLCSEFADEICESCADARCFWLEEVQGFERYNHCVVEWRGKYYDAECLDGVLNLNDLPLVKHQRLNYCRADVLEKSHGSQDKTGIIRCR